MKRLMFTSVLLAVTSALAQPSASTLAATPPMGWNSWNKFGCNVDEKMLRDMADAMVSSGMKDAGYQYIVIDDCWQVSRDEAGNIVPDPQHFPGGMKALGDYIHGKGLKFGIYSDAGEKTCAGRPGSQGHEFQDAKQYAAWGVDYLKYDWCNVGTADAQTAYALMRKALDASGRRIVFSMCEWGTAKPWLWARGIGNLWRTTGDVMDKWDGKEKWSNGMLVILDLQAELYPYSGPGHWNDPDMLEVGNGGMTDSEYQAHFSLWAMLAAPLIAGNDLRAMPGAIHDILTNKEVIAIDQDLLGRQARRVHKEAETEVWARPLADGSRAAVLLNRSQTAQQVTVNWLDLDYPTHLKASVRDLWRHAELGEASGSFTATVQPHGVVMVTVKPR